MKHASNFGWPIVAFAIGFALGSTAIRYAGSVMDVREPIGLKGIEAKTREAAVERPDVIFMGPSHIVAGIIPEIFDAELSRYAKVSSYNLALGGHSVPQIEKSLKRFFAVNPCCVKYVIFYPGFELTEIARAVDTGSIAYFDVLSAVHYWSLLRDYDPTPAPHLDLSGYARAIIVSTLSHYTNFGMGWFMFFGVSQPVADTRSLLRFDNRWRPRGFFALDKAVPASDIKPWLASIEDLKNQQFTGHAISSGMFSDVESIIAVIQQHGAQAIVVRPPTLWQWPYASSFVRKYKQECPDGPPLLDFGDPAAYPELYEAQNHFDGAHLNTRGAVLWSRILADQVGELIRSGRLNGPSLCERRL
jgi:hypothetical protein